MFARSHAAADPQRLHVGGAKGSTVFERRRASGARTNGAQGPNRDRTPARMNRRFEPAARQAAGKRREERAFPTTKDSAG